MEGAEVGAGVAVGAVVGAGVVVGVTAPLSTKVAFKPCILIALPL